jgi:transcriptional regulator with GAF, ATPase, and Fis domain
MKSLLSFPQEYNLCLSLTAFFEINFCLDWIVELTGNKPSRVLAVLDEGTQQGWIEKLQDGFFAFKDLKIKQALQEHLTLTEKQNLHRQIAELLIRELPDNPESAEVIASHLFNVPLDLDGCRLLLRSADTARHNRLFTKALSCYEKVIDDISVIGGSTADLLYIKAILKYARFAIARQNCEKVISILQEAIIRAKKHEMKRELFLLTMHMAKNDFLQSRYFSAQTHFDEGWAIIKNIDIDPRFMLSANAFHIFSYFWQGYLNQAIRTYEKSESAIETFPMEENPILAAAAVGSCYARSGQVTQGLGMLHALRKHCLEKGDLFLAGDIEVTISGIMIELRRPDEAIAYLENYKAGDCENDWNVIRAKAVLFFAYFLKGKKKEAMRHFNNWIERVKEIDVTIILNVFWFEVCKAMDEGKFPRLGGILLEDEVRRFEECGNILMKGTAYRYRAFIQERENQSHEKIIESLALSVKFLSESGHIFELCRTYLKLLQLHTLIGNAKTAHDLELKISEILGATNLDFVPRDLQWFVKKKPRDWQSLSDELIKLSQDISVTRDKKQLQQIILSTANRLTGAERGAIFSIGKHDNAPKILLTASKNITSVDINQQSFKPVMKMVEEVAASRKGRITKISTQAPLSYDGNEHILSQIAVPMVVRSRVVGVLYHDNTHYVNSFQEADLKLLSGFASQAAIALDHAEAYEEIQRLNQKLNEEKQYYKEQAVANIHSDDILGVSPLIMEVLNKINQVANTDTTVLILGETGVGKDLVARALHLHSKRANQPFIKVLCNALPESLIPSELFGHEKGAFTGSVQRRIGRFELADGGTIFLDEIGDLQLDVQTRLLQVLQSKEFERVGGSETIRSDFRLITATNRDLADAVKNQKFRSDLYYRLNVFPIYVPPLRDRKDDIPLLVCYFIKNFSARMGKTFDGIPKKEMEKLMQYNWPGNIRELEGIIERATVLSQNHNFRVPELGTEKQEVTQSKSDLTLEENERSHILQTLKKAGWKVRGEGGAAELLNVHYSTLFFRMKKLGIQRPPELSQNKRKRSLPKKVQIG